jgi:hypothetical protein
MLPDDACGISYVGHPQPPHDAQLRCVSARPPYSADLPILLIADPADPADSADSADPADPLIR